MEEFIAVPEHLHTEEMQDIIGKPPVWIYRWGISLILIVVLIGVSISAFISYPETVQTQITIHSTSSPRAIYFKDSMQLVKLYVQTRQLVKKGQHLADISNGSGISAVSAPQNGRLIFAGIIHKGVQLASKHPAFYIVDPNESYYGEMLIPRNSINKIKPGQDVLLSLRNSHDMEVTPTGYIKYIIDDPLNGNISIAEVDFNTVKNDSGFFLKNGLITDAKVITANTTIFQRLVRGMMKTKNR